MLSYYIYFIFVEKVQSNPFYSYCFFAAQFSENNPIIIINRVQ